jgi:hypothetical protein
MLPYFKSIQVDNLEQLQSAVFEIMPLMPTAGYDSYAMFHNWKDTIRSMPDIENLLCQHNWQNKVVSCAIIVMLPFKKLPIHIDYALGEPDSNCALNIPLINSAGADTIWYSTDSNPEIKFGPNNKWSEYSYNDEDCVENVRTQLSQPTLVNIKLPHSVENLQPHRRVILTIRFTPDVIMPLL